MRSPKLRPIQLSTALLFTIVSGILLSGPSMTAAGLVQTSSVETVIISGNSILASSGIDICSAILLGSCPLGLELSDQYTEPLTVRTQIMSPTLQPEGMETTEVLVAPGTPNLVLTFTFTLGSNAYNYSVPLPTMQSPGDFTVDIPLTQILSNLVALGIPSTILNLFGISLHLPIALSSTLHAEVVTSGFTSSGDTLIWNKPGSILYNSTLTGTSDTSYIAINGFNGIFSVDASFLLKLPFVSPMDLYTFHDSLANFGASASISIGQWYHVAITTPYSQTSNSGWYLPGSFVPLDIQDRQVTVGSNQYQFSSWKGSGDGSYTGSEMSHAIVVSGPVTEEATWTEVQSASPIGGIFGADPGPSLLALVTIVVAVAAGGGAILLIVTRRRSRKA